MKDSEKKQRYFCPICRKYNSGWEKGGTKNRNKKFCPSCKSKPRHRLLWQHLKSQDLHSLISTNQEFMILHVAPEECLFGVLNKKLPPGRYITADLDESRPNVSHSFSVDDIPFADGTFDLIICNHVLEHVDSDERAVKEMLRVTSKTGKAIVTVPIDVTRNSTFEDAKICSPESRAEHFGQWDHVRAYGTDVLRRFASYGAAVTVQTNQTVAPRKWSHYGLKRSDILIILSPADDAGQRTRAES